MATFDFTAGATPSLMSVDIEPSEVLGNYKGFFC